MRASSASSLIQSRYSGRPVSMTTATRSPDAALALASWTVTVFARAMAVSNVPRTRPNPQRLVYHDGSLWVPAVKPPGDRTPDVAKVQRRTPRHTRDFVKRHLLPHEDRSRARLRTYHPVIGKARIAGRREDFHTRPTPLCQKFEVSGNRIDHDPTAVAPPGRGDHDGVDVGPKARQLYRVFSWFRPFAFS